MSLAFAIALTATPLPWWIAVSAWTGVAIFVLLWWFTPNKAADQRGELYLTILSFNHEEDSLVAHLTFRNNDSFDRTVVGVSFIYRASKSDKSWAFFPSGPRNAAFIGHIEPVKISPKSEETRRYAAKIGPDRLKVIGAEAGLLITFTSPDRGDDSALVLALQVVKPADVLGWNLLTVKNLSLDSIAESRKVDALVREYKASQQASDPSKYLGYVKRLFDY